MWIWKTIFPPQLFLFLFYIHWEKRFYPAKAELFDDALPSGNACLVMWHIVLYCTVLSQRVCMTFYACTARWFKHFRGYTTLFFRIKMENVCMHFGYSFTWQWHFVGLKIKTFENGFKFSWNNTTETLIFALQRYIANYWPGMQITALQLLPC